MRPTQHLPRAIMLAILTAGLTVLTTAACARGPVNPLIDDAGFVRDVNDSQRLRATRRLSEAEFIRMAKQPGTVVLDARSERLFALRHVAGAVNLSFSEFTKDTLARVIPTRGTRVLIYCNNNFFGAPESMATKAPSASLNLSTYTSLYTYGYRNVYELAPAVDVARSKLEFAGSEVAQPNAARVSSAVR
jgi:phage shock protein E